MQIILTRRSVRKYTNRPVDDALVEKILEAGRWAPSGLNNQPWRFAVIRDAALRERISALTHYTGIIKSAPVLIAVFLDNASGYHRVKDAQAIGACIQNMLLEAHSLGLGAVWLGEIIKADRQLRGILGLGPELELMAVVALGHPHETPPEGKRKDIEKLLVFRG